MIETVAPIGYINDERQHALVTILHPSLLNAGDGFVQVAMTIDTARELRAELDAFLRAHGPQH